MAAATLNCPMCGAAASTDLPQCGHCGARLATVACPRCFGMIFLGSKYCSHCGALAEGRKEAGETGQACPRCRVPLEALVLGGTPLKECAKCGGIWASVEALDHVQKSREEQAAVLGFARPLPEQSNALEAVRYIPCPVCKKLMNRVNFARCSKVILDVCKGHGTWFDRDELRRIVEFIQGGGLDLARSKEIAELEEKRRLLEAARNASGVFREDPSRYPDMHRGIASVARFLGDLL